MRIPPDNFEIQDSQLREVIDVDYIRSHAIALGIEPIRQKILEQVQPDRS